MRNLFCVHCVVWQGPITVRHVNSDNLATTLEKAKKISEAADRMQVSNEPFPIFYDVSFLRKLKSDYFSALREQ